MELGYNYRIDDIRSSIGLVQLRKLKAFNEKRRMLSSLYVERLGDIDEIMIPFRQFMTNGERVSSFHIFPILIAEDKSKRDTIREQLSAKGVQTSVHYRPVHLFEIYRDRFGYKRGDLPLTEWVADHELTLPLYPRMTKEDLVYVTDSLKECLVSSK